MQLESGSSNQKVEERIKIIMVCQSLAFFNLLVVTHIIFFGSYNCSAIDALSHDNCIRDNTGGTLVSAGGRFELGFFGPNGSLAGGRRYVGIWYYNLSPQIVVWVANRDKPLNKSVGVFAIRDGNLKLLDTTAGSVYWSTDLALNLSSNLTVKLMDSGNLVLSDDKQSAVWQSFEDPTDTFLPHMKMTKSLTLTSWRDKDDPGKGDFTFKVDEESEDEFIIIRNNSVPYWKSREPWAGRMVEVIRYVLSNFSTLAIPTSPAHSNLTTLAQSSDYDDMRLVIDFTGQIQYFKWEKETRNWTLLLGEPKDKCSVFNACGDFGSCNNENRIKCKCLPGFKPSSPEQWSSGDFFGGCTRKTILCSGGEDAFLSLKMMKLGTQDSSSPVDNEAECRMKCRGDCQCRAYSFEKSENSNRRRDTNVSNRSCRMWYSDLNNIQEEYVSGGRNIYVRVALSDLGTEPCPVYVFSAFFVFLFRYVLVTFSTSPHSRAKPEKL